jgi:hypothetical protein
VFRTALSDGIVVETVDELCSHCKLPIVNYGWRSGEPAIIVDGVIVATFHGSACQRCCDLDEAGEAYKREYGVRPHYLTDDELLHWWNTVELS